MSRMKQWRAVPLGEALDWLESMKEQQWAVAQTTPGSQQRSEAMKRYQQWESAYSSLNRVLGYLAVGDAPEGSQGACEAVEPVYFEAPCPACGQPVERGAGGVVWTCPADREKGEPGWMPPVVQVTKEQMARRNVWSNCGHEYGVACYQQVPLHEKCHEKDFIVYAPNPRNNRRAL